ncbi:MAG: hypothetical protein PHQ53_00970 [Candidatus Krumholzibacteria bacterium]|nr:hypothetical protein [Candidatus Krumholzibacteria bacterium]
MQRYLFILALAVLAGSLGVTAAAAQDKARGKEEANDSRWSAGTFSGLKWRALGPALMSGRIGDIAVNPRDKAHWYVAVASGNLWETRNGGVTFKPIFDDQGSYSFRCVAIDPTQPQVVWLGTGENNSQRSVSYGDGVYKSRDGGRS